jgi:hypothetical protein
MATPETRRSARSEEIRRESWELEVMGQAIEDGPRGLRKSPNEPQLWATGGSNDDAYCASRIMRAVETVLAEPS